ncbi:hypothetical protein VNO78_26725 [Psophocarpus tetragonolobus]|uniref:Uncharacterized protein n=1 Tax=Psophocarpus tetragonolobus TaxID=3891 RepID=A0AAN9XB26_PSOTE
MSVERDIMKDFDFKAMRASVTAVEKERATKAMEKLTKKKGGKRKETLKAPPIPKKTQKDVPRVGGQARQAETRTLVVPSSLSMTSVVSASAMSPSLVVVLLCLLPIAVQAPLSLIEAKWYIITTRRGWPALITAP